MTTSLLNNAFRIQSSTAAHACIKSKNALYVELGGSVISYRLFNSHISIGGELGTFTRFKKILGDHVNTFRKDKIMILSLTNCETVNQACEDKMSGSIID